MGDRERLTVTFYDEMREMAAELLSPDADGGFGQGVVVLEKLTTAAPSASSPWEKAVTTPESETLKAAVKGVSEMFVGTTGDNGAIIVASDREVIASPPALEYAPGDRLLIDGKAATVLLYRNLPAAGTRVAVRFIIRN